MMEVTLHEHPARQVLPAAPGHTPTVVPLIDDMLLIRLNGIGVGYLSLVSGGVIMNARPGGGRWPPSVLDKIRDVCGWELKLTGKTVTVTQPPELPQEDDDE